MNDKIYMQIDLIEGNCTDSAYRGWIQLNSFELHASRPIEFKNYTPSKAPLNSYPSLSEITITKTHCSASPELYSALNTLKKLSVTIDSLHDKISDGGNILEQVTENTAGTACTRYEMDTAYVSDHKILPNGNELITLTVSSLKMSYRPSIKSGEKPVSAAYNYQMKTPL